MRIFTDIRCLQDNSYAERGVGSHSHFILKAIRSQLSVDVEIIGLSDPDIGPLHPSHEGLCDSIRPTFHVGNVSEPSLFLQLSPMTHDTRLPAMLLDRPGIIPLAVIYDFIPLRFSKQYLAQENLLYSYCAALKWLRAYNHYLPISEHVGNETVQLLGAPKDRITVTGVALREAFQSELLKSSTDIKKQVHGSNENNKILFVGGADPRKNLDFVCTSLACLNNSACSFGFDVVGNYPLSKQKDIHKKFSSIAEHIKFHTHVTDRELSQYYQNASLTIVASQAEGFSMPVIEAMACGSPVLASNIPVHRELVALDDMLFEPNNAGELKRKIEYLLANRSLREEIARGQKTTALRFTEKQVAKRFTEAAETVIQNYHEEPQSSRHRVAILSPFPPDHSGVADYSWATVKELSKRVDVDIYTNQPNPILGSGADTFYPISAAAWLRPDYDSVISVVGNSHFHIEIMNLHSRYGGPVIVHDNSLYEVLKAWKGVRYVQEMAENHLGKKVVHSNVKNWNERPEHLPTMFFNDLLIKSFPFIVHSLGIQKNLQKHYQYNAAYLPFCIYNNVQIRGSSESRQEIRKQLGIPGDQRVVVTFGLVNSIKKPDICVRAIAKLAEDGVESHLYFVGGSDEVIQNELNTLAKQLGVRQLIHFLQDWIPDEEYIHYILAADAAIQLRGNFSGGLSGALLDCIAAGLPTVANVDLARALDSPEYVIQVSDKPSQNDVADALMRIFKMNQSDSERIAICQEYREKYSFKKYCKKLLEITSSEILETDENFLELGVSSVNEA